ncbi:MAG TPA: cupredoxin family copper-binding protein [Solirubrobacteraceae bacterium]|nr:cupredoxin family copper-binding protein [Solirubrobacteraceae bacterium]
MLAPVLAAAALAAAGCGSSSKSSDNGGVVSPPATTSSGAAAGGAAVPAAKVLISNFKYVPPAITVKAGGAVTWTNADSAPHTATAKAGSAFDTGTLNQGQSKKVTFSKAGTFQYTCTFHPFMSGTVVVR